MSVVLALCACNRSNGDSKGAGICDSLAISSGIGAMLLDETTAQIASADRAMTRWSQWEQKEIQADGDKHGLFSDAGRRAERYENTAIAVCLSAAEVYRGMSELARDVHDDEIHTVADHVADLNCGKLISEVISPEASDRTALASRWTADAGISRDAAKQMNEVCTRKFGTRPVSPPPPFFLLTEEALPSPTQ
jgi:hypothetical protein